MKQFSINWKKIMRRTACLICAVCILLAGVNFDGLARGETAAQYETIEVTEGTLIARMKTNVRQGPGTNHPVLAEMKPGETCIVQGEEGDWYQIEYGDIQGYIAREYISVKTYETQVPLPTATPEPTELPSPMPGYEYIEVVKGTVISQLNINVREGAGTGYDVLLQLAPGDTCTVLELEEDEEWCRIRFGEVEGYVAKEYLEITVEMILVPIATPTPEITETPTPTPEEEETPAPTDEPDETPVPTQAPEAEPGYEWVEVNVGTLIAQMRTNVREGAGTNHDIIDHMSPGETCTVLGEEGDWYRIEFEGNEGYIAKEYIEVSIQMTQAPIATPTPEPTATPEPTETPVPAETSAPGHELREALVGTVIAEASVSVRKGPGTDYEATDYIMPGKTCIVLDDEKEWYEVLYNGFVGYVAKEYLEVEETVTQVPLATATPKPTEEPTATETPASGYEMQEMLVGTVISEAKINVRTGAGTEYKAVKQLAPGETCIVLGEEGDWYQIETDGQTGYAAKEYIETAMQMVAVPVAAATPAPTEIPTAAPGYELVEVVEGTLNTQIEANVRKGPGTDYSVVTRMKPGETCTVLAEEGDWYRVEYDGRKGYIAKEYIDTRSYITQVPIIEEEPLDAYAVGFALPRTMVRKDTVTLEGVVESNIPMTSVEITIYDRRNMVEESSSSMGFAHDEGVRIFDLNELNDDLRFSRLSAGEKRVTVTVYSANDEQIVYETDFYVLGECDDPVSITGECEFTSRASRADRVTDGRYSTAWQPEAAGDEMLITVPSDAASETLTLEWTDAPSGFEVDLDGETVVVSNEAGMVSFSIATGGAAQITVRAADAQAGICEARVYAQGRTPDVVQDWQPASDNVDMMVVVAHQGDEFLFFGGAIPQAVAEGKEVLVVYMADCGRERYAEAMEGLWAVGVRTHPVCLGLENGRAREYEDAIDMWGLEETYEVLVELLRRYKPEVVLTHDIDGEDGDNQHKLTSATLRRAVLLAIDPDTYPESSAQYGVWDVKRTYIHRYEGNVLTLEADLPLDGLNGWTLREMTGVGFNKHRTLMEDFDLEDGEEYSPYSYGMIRTAIIGDAGAQSSFFDNLEENIE